MQESVRSRVVFRPVLRPATDEEMRHEPDSALGEPRARIGGARRLRRRTAAPAAGLRLRLRAGLCLCAGLLLWAASRGRRRHWFRAPSPLEVIMSSRLIGWVAGAALLVGATTPALAQRHGHDGGWHDHGWRHEIRRDEWRDRDIHRFRDHDFDRWHGGHWFHGRHGGRLGWWWLVGPN